MWYRCEEAKDKVKDMDMKEDVNALTDGEDLSEEFKAKAATIFESAVKAKLVEEIEKLESEYETKVDEKVSEVKEEIVDKVDAYLNYVVEEWMKENELAIEKGLRNEITEDFIGASNKPYSICFAASLSAGRAIASYFRAVMRSKPLYNYLKRSCCIKPKKNTCRTTAPASCKAISSATL